MELLNFAEVNLAEGFYCHYNNDFYSWEPVPPEQWATVRAGSFLVIEVEPKGGLEEPFTCQLVENKINHPTQAGLEIKAGNTSLTVPTSFIKHLLKGVIFRSGTEAR